MADNLLGDLLGGEDVQIDARDLKGRVRVISSSQLASFVSQKVERTRNDTLREAIGPGDVPEMLDKYMAEIEDLKSKNGANEILVAEYERKIQELEARVQSLEAGGGGGGLDPSPYMNFDGASATMELATLSEQLGQTETALNEVENMEESWVFIEKIAAIRAEVDRLSESLQASLGNYTSFSADEPPNVVGLAESIKEMEAVEREAKALGTAVGFIRALLGLD